MAKRVRLSDDDGSTWYTLPGMSAQLTFDTGDIDDTIFGQDYKSSETGLIGWQISGDALYKGFAGYVADVKKIGSTTSFTDEAMSVETGLIYAIDAATKTIWNRAVAITVKDNGVAVDASDIEWIDYLFGRIKFVTGYSVAGAITVSGSYFPTTSIGKANAFTLTQTAEAVDNTDFDTAQANSGHKTFQQGLKTVALELEGIYASANGFLTALIARSEVIVEVNPDGASRSVARGFFKYAGQSQQGDVGALEEERVQLRLNVPDLDSNYLPFEWRHTNTSTLSTAVKMALTAWQTGDEIDVQYLPDGTTGRSGNCIVTEITLSGGLEDMNKFAVTLQGSGATASV